MRLARTAARVLAFLALVFSMGLSASLVSAHANIVRSNPENGSVLLQSPKTMTIEFNEPLDPAYSRVRLVDRASNIISPGPGKVDPNNSHILILDLLPLADGTYTAIWLSRSAIDGHNSAGNIAFAVGQPNLEVSLLPPPGQALPSASLPSWPDVAVRWVLYISAALMGGGIAFGQFVWRPAFQSWAEAGPEADDTIRRIIQRQVAAGGLVLGLVTIFSAVSQAINAGAGTWNGTVAFQWIADPRQSLWLWLRLSLAIAIGVIIFLLPAPGGGRSAAWRGMLLPVLVILASLSLTSHSAAGGALPIVLDLVHLASMSAWFGGLLTLFLALRRTGMPAAWLAPFFTRLALASVAVLALTGLYSGLNHVGSLEALFRTVYGRAMLVKVGMFGVLSGLGAVNLLVLTPRLKQAAAKTSSIGQPGQVALAVPAGARWLAGTVRTEMVTGVLLLGAVAVISSTAPANDAMLADRRLGYVGGYTDQGVTLNLWLTPGRAGDNELAVDVRDSRPLAAGQPPEVVVRCKYMQHYMGKVEVKATSQDGQRFTVRGSYLSMAGAWTIEVAVITPGLSEVQHQFPISVLGHLNE